MRFQHFFRQRAGKRGSSGDIGSVLREFRPGPRLHRSLPCSSPQNHLEIPSFDTTVRRRPDRSRPPQVGAAAHTCTESADRTASAKHSGIRSQPLPDIASATRPASALPPRRWRSLRRKHGGPGEIISPGGARGSAPPLVPVPLSLSLSNNETTCFSARAGQGR